MEKPRLTYAEFMARTKRYADGSMAALIERFIREMNGLDGKPPVRPLGESHAYMLRRHQREELIGPKMAATLTKSDIVAYAKWRKDDCGVCPATITQDITYLTGVLKYAGSAWDDCAKVSAAPIEAAKPFLIKHGIIAKSTPRDRRPTQEEIDRLLAHFAREYGGRGFKRRIDMVLMTRWQLASGRRVGESCALLWEDWNREDHTILVRKMKDPKNKNKRKVVALPAEAQAMLEELHAKRDPNEPRIFPYRKASVSAAYTHAKKALGIENLRLHDSRRDCASRLIEQGYSAEEAIGFTGHETTAVFMRTYMRARPERLKDGPAAKR